MKNTACARHLTPSSGPVARSTTTQSSPPSRWVASLTLIALLLGTAMAANAATATWNLAGGGTWNATASWTPTTIPDVNTATAVFSKDFTTTAPTFTLDRNTAFTVNSISFQDTTTPFLSGTISVGTGTGSPGLIFAGTTPTVTAASTGASDLTISCPVDVTAGLTKAGSRKVTLSGTITGFGAGVYNNVTAGTLEISTLNVDWTAVNKTGGAGTLQLDTLSTMTVPATFSVGAGTLSLNPASGTFAHDATGFTKTGNGSLQFYKAATGSSALSVSAGTLYYAAGVSGFTSGTVASGASLQIATTTTLPALALNGNGTLNTLEFPTGNNTTYTLGGITLSGDVIIRVYGLNNVFNFPNAIASSGANSLTFKTEGGNTTGQPHTFNLNAASSYTGATTISAITQQGILKLGINNALPVTTVLTLNGGGNANTSANLDLNGKNQTLAGLNGTPNTGKSIVYATTAGTLTINNSSPYTFSGIIGLSTKTGVSLTKSGAGTQTFTGANIYTGVTTINRGILNAGAAQVGSTSGPLGASGNIIFGGGTLQFSAASAAWDPSARIAAGTSSSAVSIDANGQAVTFATALTSSQSGGLTLANSTGTGSLTLSAANGYTGNTTISAGTLALSASGSISSGSSVNIAAGAAFDVSANTGASGTYTWGSTAGLTATGGSSVATAAKITAGATATVDLTGRSLTLTFTPGNISGDTTHPALNVSAGTLNLASTTIAVNNSGSPLDVGDYTLISGTVAGTPMTTTVTVGGNGLVSGALATLDASSGQLMMHVTSPATVTTTTLTRTGGGSPSTYGDSLTFHAVISPDPGNGTTITFKTNGVAIGTATTTSGAADLSLSTLQYSGGSAYVVTASFAGNPSFTASAGSLGGGQQVNQYALTLTGATAQNKIFDNTTAATITGGTLSSTVNGDVIGTSAAFATSTAGTGKAVTVTLTGTPAANYSLTLVSPSSLTASIYTNPTWANVAGGSWDTAGNWVSSTIGTGSGATADLSQLDITADTTVSLNSARTIGNLIFGDTTTGTAAGWTLDNNSTPANILTLAGTTPTVTVNALGGTKTATISAVVAGATLTKTGAGTLVLSGANTYSGGTTIAQSQSLANALRLANSQAAGTGAITIGGGGNSDQARLELTGGITVGNSLNTWTSRNTAAPNILNVSGVNQINGAISVGGGGSQSTLQSDAGNLILLGNITARQLNLIGAGDGELRGVVSLPAANSLVKDGAGTWTLSRVNTYVGSTTISGGTLALGASGSIDNSPTNMVAAGAVFDVSAVSGGFTLGSAQTLKGKGTVRGAVKVSGTIAAGTSVGTLSTGSQTWAAGGTNEVEMSSVTGTPGTDWDLLAISGDLTVTATNHVGPDLSDVNKFKIRLVSLNSLGAFNPSTSYAWTIAAVSGGSVKEFIPSKFLVDTRAFTPVGGVAGTFSVALENLEVKLIYTPTTCSATMASHYVEDNFENKLVVMIFSNPSGLTSVQALRMDNCTITGREYPSVSETDTNAGTAIAGSLSLTTRTVLDPTTKKVVLWAKKTSQTSDALVNVLVMDNCGGGKSFDPVITTLTVGSGNRVQQRFEGVLSAERYLHVINATPGLKWLEVNLNGRVFRLDPLTNGQDVSSDLSAAMHEGDNNVVVLTGGGDPGANALVMITDTASGNLVALPEIVTLALSQTLDGLVLAWPDTLVGWQLQVSATTGAGWADVAEAPVSVNGQSTLKVPTASGSQFYRLVGPAPAASSAAAAHARASETGISILNPQSSQTIQHTYDGLLW